MDTNNLTNTTKANDNTEKIASDLLNAGPETTAEEQLPLPKKRATAKSSAATPKGTAAKKTPAAKPKVAAKTAAAKKQDEDKKEENKQDTNKQDGKTGAQSAEKSQVSETSKEGPLYKFFMDALKDIYFAEKHILETLPKMQKAATTEELQEAFEDHHLMTQKQISRLEKVFKSIDETPEAKKCDAIIGIVKESENIIKETEEGTMTRDAALIIAAQKVEHYEIATYGGLVALAETLELYKAADLLQVTLDEEEETDHLLTDIAETSINFHASEEDEDGENYTEEDWDDEDYDDDEDDDYEDDEDNEEEEDYRH
ncbi:ferritin-like domain-containing protein [uncultured Chryseobacterium sp.]|uniref:YciE/YciF ferroxidase family protein n=1 Tax=uncultured Chryseobacterium sp. TaxID=259322 RepID=UPI0025FDFFFD|nr:ferritin-like domain-containing protein [uncultured Chryseobacterium sp.]